MHISAGPRLKPSTSPSGFDGTSRTDERPNLPLCRLELRSQSPTYTHQPSANGERTATGANHRRKRSVGGQSRGFSKTSSGVYSVAVRRCPAAPRRPVCGSEVGRTCLPVERHHLQTTPPTLSLRRILLQTETTQPSGLPGPPKPHTHTHTRRPLTRWVATSENLIFSKRIKKNMKLTKPFIIYYKNEIHKIWKL